MGRRRKKHGALKNKTRKEYNKARNKQRKRARLDAKRKELFPDFYGIYETELKARDWALKNKGLTSANKALLKAEAAKHKELKQKQKELELERGGRAHERFMNCLDVQHERKLNRDLKKENQELLRQKRVAEAELAKTEKEKKKQVDRLFRQLRWWRTHYLHLNPREPPLPDWHWG
ncbi:unnamed protein product [Prorocentrum cordatum]|uniref:Uncharacterized protein n=1 Tax=Prorocentrum cordatum TaxID=2364126 RepID=A0ABN9XVS2_9DINO|nr:unnamed protein product [Polarella glacialis]